MRDKGIVNVRIVATLLVLLGHSTYAYWGGGALMCRTVKWQG